MTGRMSFHMKTYRKQTIIPSCYYADIVIVHLLVLCYYILQEGRSFSLSWHNTTDSSSWEVASTCEKEWEWKNGSLQPTAHQICELWSWLIKFVITYILLLYHKVILKGGPNVCTYLPMYQDSLLSLLNKRLPRIISTAKRALAKLHMWAIMYNFTTINIKFIIVITSTCTRQLCTYQLYAPPPPVRG